MKTLFTVTLFITSLILISSCGEDNPNGGVTEGLSITINSPANNSVFNMGETIVLSYTVKDDIDITTIAYSTNGQFGTGSVMASELSGTITEYS